MKESVTSVNVSNYPGNGSYTISYGHDEASRITSVTYPGNGTFTRVYSDRGYLAEVKRGGTALEKVVEHDRFGQPKRMDFGNGLRTYHDRDAFGRLTRIRTGPSSTPQSIQDLEYKWRSNGRLHFRRDLRGTAGAGDDWEEKFSYDVFDRVTQAQTIGAAPTARTLSFTYHSTGFGNLQSKTSNVAGDMNVTGMNYTNPHRLTSATIGGVLTQFNPDAAGNITSYVPTSGDHTKLVYSARGQVTEIAVGPGPNPSANPTARDLFWYDGDGDRFLKRTTWNGGDVWVLYLLGGAFEQIHPVHDATIGYRRQVQVTGTVVHRSTQPPNLQQQPTEAIEYRHLDHLNSVHAVTNSTGSLVTKLAFEPFGARRKSDWTGDLVSPAGVLMGLGSTTDRGFTDHEHLDRTGFVHMNGRVFDPRIGRFVQPDPIVQAPFFSQSYNRYAYVFNSPLSFVDPSGYEGRPPLQGAWGDHGIGSLWIFSTPRVINEPSPEDVNRWLPESIVSSQFAWNSASQWSTNFVETRRVLHGCAVRDACHPIGAGEGTELLGLGVLVWKGANVSAGGIQVLAGIGLCKTGLGCIPGSLMILSGASDITFAATDAGLGDHVLGEQIGQPLDLTVSLVGAQGLWRAPLKAAAFGHSPVPGIIVGTTDARNSVVTVIDMRKQRESE